MLGVIYGRRHDTKMVARINAYVNQPTGYGAEAGLSVGETIEGKQCAADEEITSSNPGNPAVSISSGEDAVIYHIVEAPASYQYWP